MTKYLIWPLLAFGLISCVSSPLEDRTTLNVTGQPELRAETIVGQNNAWSGFILKETAEQKLVIDDVYWHSSADRAGLRSGDTLLAVAGEKVYSLTDVLIKFNSFSPDETVELQISQPEKNITLTQGDRKAEPTEGEFSTEYDKFLENTPLNKVIRIAASKKIITRDLSLTLTKTPVPARIEKPPVFQPKTITPTKQSAWMGVQLKAVKDLTPLGGPENQKGVEFTVVLPDTPAQESGLQDNDVLVSYDEKIFAGDDDSPNATLGQYIKENQPGDIIQLSILRSNDVVTARLDAQPLVITPKQIPEQVKKLKMSSELKIDVVKNYQTIDIPIKLGSRTIPGEQEETEDWTNDSLHPELKEYTTPFEKTVRKIMESTGITEKYDDLIKRFTDDEKWEDAYRLKDMKYLHRDPFKIEKISTDLVNDLRQTLHSEGPDLATLLIHLAKKLDIVPSKEIPTDIRTGLSPEEHAKQIEAILGQAVGLRNQAFAGLTKKDMQFLADNIYRFTDHYLHDFYVADAIERVKENEIDRKILSLAKYIDYGKLFESARLMSCLLDPDYLEKLSADLKDKAAKPTIISQNTEWGKIIISGQGVNRYTEPAAVIIDLGGNDFYANSSGASALDLPVSLIIDLAGDDTYSAYTQGCQGCGLLGVGILADLAGNDDYVSQNWGQGTGLLGVGLLYDQAGDDIYRGQEYSQGAGFFGAGVLLDMTGHDYYGSNGFAQGFGSTKGVGLLFDATGDDNYYATGRYSSGYTADVGTFVGFAQGAGLGSRKTGLARSGGLGILIDNSGQDRYEAGVFSQGGGYYFAWGILVDGGDDNDTYVGTRYAQGFSAHSALGFFLEEGGNDHYLSWIGVHAGLAWDLCSTVFIDKEGDDTYDRRSGFSIGAAAHNSFCLFYDAAGNDTYNCRLDKATRNSYHGGYSLSLFLDEDSAEDKHGEDKKLKPDTI
ncbi:MAG: PDZ domain-containing protein, partial [Planctomycetes bacterium]|nr:PDZ domain-containing protein [Planctomycetota bacterium]